MDFSNVPIELLEVSNYLQKIMKKKVGNFNADKAIYFYGEDAKNSLLRFEYFNYVTNVNISYNKKKNQPQNSSEPNLPKIECVEDAERILSQLLEYHLIQAVIVEENVPQSMLPIITAKLVHPRYQLNQYYVWNYVNTFEVKIKFFFIKLCRIAIFLTVATILFYEFFTRFISNNATALFLALVKTLAFIIGIIGLFFLVRFLVFKVTQRIGQKSGRHGGLMILPELFADCTFREKFIPLYQFSETKLQKLE
ncbi:hypothetical protein H8356DRAFT_954444 [Neocallimastix lanati (nom. inval.)]|nr:hypothetical protein H8356DRAFT_954444 [Neocallimastix sp. JGI-2020a]